MRPAALLASIAFLSVVGILTAGLAVPGFAGTDDEVDKPAELDVEETTLEVEDVTGEEVTFTITAYVLHEGVDADDVTVLTRAKDPDTGLVENVTEQDLGALEAAPEHEIPIPVTVDREGEYDIELIVYVEGERTDFATASISGLEALTPPERDSTVSFHEFPMRPSVEYEIQSVSDGTATLEVRSYLTNDGDDPASNFEIEVLARHVDANVVADRQTTSVGVIDSMATDPTIVSLSVPDEQNYHLDVTLWRGDTVLESYRTTANLHPETTVEAVSDDGGFEASDFEVADSADSLTLDDEDAEAPDAAEADDPDAVDDDDMPTPGILAVVAPLIVAGYFVVRTRGDDR